MTRDDRERFQRFYAALREDSARGPGRGVSRLARLARSGVGLAASVVGASGRGEEVELGPRELRRLEGMVTELGHLKGLPMKLGQILSYLELELPEEARELLTLLQTQSPATPYERVVEVVREDLGARAAPLLARLPRAPESIASIGQVYRVTLPDGTTAAVKIRHPEIEAAIRADLRTIALGTGVAGTLVPGMGATARDFVAEIAARLLEECDYALEAEHQRRFGALFAGHPQLVVPPVLGEWSGPRVLTSRWVDGQELEGFRAHATPAERDRAGAALFEFYLGSLYRHQLFHADPHPGNYRFCADGRVAIFDYGCVRCFEPGQVRAYQALSDAVRDDDRARIGEALRQLGAEPPTSELAFAHLRQLLRSFFGPLLTPGKRPIEGRIVIDMKQTMRDKLALARLRLPGQFTFLFRIRFGLYAVLSRLGAECDWAALERGFASGAGASRASAGP